MFTLGMRLCTIGADLMLNVLNNLERGNLIRESQDVKYISFAPKITKDMLIKNTYEGNYYAKKNAVMYDLQNGKQNVVCFCDNIYTAQGIVE